MKVAIHGKVVPENTAHIIEYTIKQLTKKKIEFALSDGFYDQVLEQGIELHNCEIYKPGCSFEPYDFIISLGGDGTLLETITHVGRYETPILGVNIGRLGFLATTNKEMISEALKHIEDHNFEIDSRMLLKVEAIDPTLRSIRESISKL